MLKLLQKYKNNSFIKNSVILTIGTVIAQGVPVLFSPVLSRMFPPEQFGLLAILTSITVILSTISTGKYESAILIAPSKKEAASLVFIALLLSAFFSLFVILLLLLFSPSILALLKQPSLGGWIFIAPFTSFFISIYLSYNEWCVRNSYFKNLSFNKITNTSSIALSSIILGFSKVISGGLVIGDVIGRFFSAGACVFHAAKTDYTTFKEVSFTNIKAMAKRYLSFPKFIMPAQLLNVVGGQMPVLLIGSYFGSKELGYFVMVNMVLGVPISVISNAIRDVFRQRASEDYQKHNSCLYIYKKTVTSISIISVVIFSLLFFISPWLFPFVFGKTWEMSGQYAQILVPLVALGFIVESVSGMFFVAEKTKLLFIWQVLYFLFITLSLSIGYWFFNDIKATIICFAFGKGIVYLISFVMTYQIAKGEIFSAK